MSPIDTQGTHLFIYLKERFQVTGHLLQTAFCFLLPLLPEPVPGSTVTSLFMNTEHTTGVKTNPTNTEWILELGLDVKNIITRPERKRMDT